MGKPCIIIGLLFILLSCDDSETNTVEEFTVVVESTADLACALPLVRFKDSMLKVKGKTSVESLVYTAYQLDPSLNVQGAELIIEFKDVLPEDLRVCNTLGIFYPSIAIVTATKVN